MIAYKLFKLRKDGSLGPLFINKRQRLHRWTPGMQPYVAESHPTKGFTVRPGWHCCAEPKAPHLSTKGRVWCVIEIPDDSVEHHRPQAQGGLWYTADYMFIIETIA